MVIFKRSIIKSRHERDRNAKPKPFDSFPVRVFPSWHSFIKIGEDSLSPFVFRDPRLAVNGFAMIHIPTSARQNVQFFFLSPSCGLLFLHQSLTKTFPSSACALYEFPLNVDVSKMIDHLGRSECPPSLSECEACLDVIALYECSADQTPFCELMRTHLPEKEYVTYSLYRINYNDPSSVFQAGGLGILFHSGLRFDRAKNILATLSNLKCYAAF